MHTTPRSRSHASALLTALTLAALSLGIATGCAHAERPQGPLRVSGGAYDMEVLVDGTAQPTYRHRGQDYVLGQHGDRYTLRIHNHTPRRVEAVVSVDGRDVLDGTRANYRTKRGYLVPAYGFVDIEGWRLSQADVAAFRFSTVAQSYAAKTGSARDVGVIGVAIFPERREPQVHRVPRPTPRPYPMPEPYPMPYGQRLEGRGSSGDALGSADDFGGGADAPASPAAKSESRARRSAPRDEARPGLGTEFGERMSSYTETVPFTRAHATLPAVLLGARYNDRAGLLALGIDVDHRWHRSWDDSDEAEYRESASPFSDNRRYARPPRDWNW